jgi:cobalamin biosynthesis protein CbiG
VNRHQDGAIELVVETESGFVIVEKDGHAGVVADLADPRGGD